LFRITGAIMSKYKPRTIKHPVRLQKNNPQKIIYRTVRDIQQLKNSSQIGTVTINKQSVMVRKESTCWVVV
jgi:hypothetical protein